MKNTTKKGLLYIFTALWSIVFMLAIMPKMLRLPWPIILLSVVQSIMMMMHGLETLLKETDPLGARFIGKIANTCFILVMILSIPAIVSLLRSGISSPFFPNQ